MLNNPLSCVCAVVVEMNEDISAADVSAKQISKRVTVEAKKQSRYQHVKK